MPHLIIDEVIFHKKIDKDMRIMITNKIKIKEVYLKYSIFFLSILFIFTGIYRNEIKILFTKAINICLECIGIG